jgi:hypothetical protein
MNSARSVTSLTSIYFNQTIKNSLLDWLNTFNIDSHPHSFSTLFNGVALYEVLNKVDNIYWPKSKLQKINNNSMVQKISISNF